MGAHDIPNTRFWGDEKLRCFIRTMEVPEPFKSDLEEHMGIPSVRARYHPAQPEVIVDRVGIMKKCRKSLLFFGIR